MFSITSILDNCTVKCNCRMVLKECFFHFQAWRFQLITYISVVECLFSSTCGVVILKVTLFVVLSGNLFE